MLDWQWLFLKWEWWFLLSTGVGTYGLVYSAFQYVLKRLVEDIPRSRVRSVAMGICELQGVVRAWRPPIKTYYSGLDCVLYRFRLERLSRDRNRETWHTIQEGKVLTPFYLEDETGKIVVNPDRMLLELDLGFEGHSETPPVPGMMLTVAQQERQKIPWPLTVAGAMPLYRVREWFLAPGDPVYVLGGVARQHDVVEDQRQKLLARLRDLKADPDRMKALDLNKDGQVDATEWDRAVQQMEHTVLQEQLASLPNPDSEELVVTWAPWYHVGIISRQDEQAFLIQLRSRIRWGVAWGVCGLGVAALGKGIFHIMVPWWAILVVGGGGVGLAWLHHVKGGETVRQGWKLFTGGNQWFGWLL
ncbi:MAG: hypothetical protein HYZ73_03820 [Elusimicrobia bacterium]|nr:hypothetical protein [Elusimicrobiota bacterium]